MSRMDSIGHTCYAPTDAGCSNDLDEIFSYIGSRSGLDRATVVVREIYRVIQILAENSGIGHEREDLTSDDLLFWAVYSYLVVYRPDTRPLEIVRIVHGARDPKTMLQSNSRKNRGEE